MASQSRKYRGYETQGWLAEWFKARGWPFAEAVGAGRPGVDVTGMPGVAVEAKARAKFEPKAWLRQAGGERRHGLPVVIFRCNGQGKAALPEWGALMRLDDLTELLRSAGYGGPSEGDERPEPHDEDAEDEHQLDSSLGLPAVVAVTHTSHGKAEA